MSIKSTSHQANAFYQTALTSKTLSWSDKICYWFRQKRIAQLESRIDAIQEALRYELAQNHAAHVQQELSHSAHHMCVLLSHKQQRLLTK